MCLDCNKLLCGCFPQALEFTAYFWGWKLEEKKIKRKGKREAHLHYKTAACFSGEYL